MDGRARGSGSLGPRVIQRGGKQIPDRVRCILSFRHWGWGGTTGGTSERRGQGSGQHLTTEPAVATEDISR